MDSLVVAAMTTWIVAKLVVWVREEEGSMG
jgi:hypothetical protein